MPTTRYYQFEVIYYAEHDIQVLLDNIKSVRFLNHYLISPCHDKDLDKDGAFKKPHYHVYCTFNIHQTYKSVSRLFCQALSNKAVTENCVTVIQSSLYACYLYSFHSDSDDSNKPTYDKKLIVSDKLSHWFRGYQDCNNTSYNILTDMEDNIPMRILAQKYGRELILNYYKYRDFMIDMKYQEHVEQSDNDKI